MNSNYSKKNPRGRNIRLGSDSKSSYRNQESYFGERRKSLSDATLYNITRFLMGNEVQVLTKNNRIEGILRGFDSSTLWLSKVFVYDRTLDDRSSVLKDISEGKDVWLRDVLMIKVIGLSGKTDNVLMDQDISERKLTTKSLQSEDIPFAPYFDQDEQLEEEKYDLDGENGDFAPEEMLKKNKELFYLDSTFNDNMDGYTTQIDRNDPLLAEKYKIADKLAREIENDSSLRRFKQSDEEDETMDEEARFSAVVSLAPQSAAPLAPVPSNQMKLNPNAPEFHPKHMVEELSLSVIPEPLVLQQQQQQQQQSSHQSQPAVMQRYAMPMSIAPHAMVTQPVPQGQVYTGGQRLVGVGGPQWTLHAGPPPPQVQYVYQQHAGAQIVPSGAGFQTRQLGPGEAAAIANAQQAASILYYQDGPFGAPIFMQPQAPPQQQQQQHHLPTEASHIYASAIDPAAQLASQFQQLRQPHLIPANIPHAQQQQQLSNYYQPQTHQMLAQPINAAGAHATFPQLVLSQHGGFITNGRS